MLLKQSVWLLAITLAAAGAAGQTRADELLVLNKEDNVLAVIDPGSFKVLGTVPTGEGPHEVAVSSDGKTAFVTNYGKGTPGQTITVIDLEKRTPRTVDLGFLRRPHGAIVVAGRVYFTAEINKAVARYSPDQNRVDWLVGTGQDFTHMVVADREGKRLFTSNVGSNSVSIIDLTERPAGPRLTTVQVGKAPEAIDLSPDQRELWVGNSRDGTVSIVDVASNKVVQTVDLHLKLSNRLKFTPDGKRVLISDVDAGEVVVVDVMERKEIARIPVGPEPEGILVRPDGKVAYVASGTQGKVMVVDLATLKVRNTFSPGAGPDGMAWVSAH